MYEHLVLKISQSKPGELFTFSKAWYMGTVPTGMGEFLRIHSRVCLMCVPVDKSMSVSAPQSVDHCSFSTSASTLLTTSELPMLLFTFTCCGR